MKLGGVGTVRKLLLCGTVVAAAQGAPNAVARPRHHTTTHHHPTHHAAATHGKTANAPAGPEQGKAAAPGTSATGGGGGEKLELVPGPTPLPTPAPRNGANAATPGAIGPAGATGQQTKSAVAEPARPAPPPTAPAPPAKGAIATAVAKLFVGEPVYGAKGQEIGRLSKIVTGPDGQVKSAVVSWGGLFGYFQSSRTIAWPEAGPSVRGGKLVLEKMTKDELRNSTASRPEASR